MLGQPLKYGGTGRGAQAEASLSCARRNRLANVDRLPKPLVPVALGHTTIVFVVSRVVNRVDSRSNELATGGSGPTSCFNRAPATLSPRLRVSSGLKGASGTCGCHKRIEYSHHKVGACTNSINRRRCESRPRWSSSFDRQGCYVQGVNR